MDIQAVSSPVTAIIDAKGLIIGRMASVVAKRLLAGEQIVIVNAGEAVFAGKKSSKLKDMQEFLDIGGRWNPKYSPRHPRRPDNILRRVIRGMLPMDKAKGRQAFKQLKVHVLIPPELVASKTETIEVASARRLRCSYVSLGKIAKGIGYRGM